MTSWDRWDNTAGRCVLLVSVLCFFFGTVLQAQTAASGDQVPETVMIPTDPGVGPAGFIPEKPEKDHPFKQEPLLIRGPQAENIPRIIQEVLAPAREVRVSFPPDFYLHSQMQPLPASARSFLDDLLIPGESFYFQPKVGMDVKTGMPYDHIRIRLEENLLSEVGNYTAASKLSLLIPYLVKVIQRDPGFRNVKLAAPEATLQLKRVLQTLLDFIKNYPDYGGFLPWVDIRPNGTIAPASTKVPSLDNGQLTWALAAVVAAFEDSKEPELLKIVAMAQTILQRQDYRIFYDAEKGLLHGTIQYDPATRTWYKDETYYLNDMFEGTLAVLWGILQGQIPEKAWYNLLIPTKEYTTEAGEKITTFEGFRASFHEHWALAFLPLMESDLAPLYQSYLYAQADHAHRNGLPGFSSTAYDAQGVYRQMGIPEISGNPVDRSDVSVLFATAMGMLISPTVGAAWLSELYNFKGLVSSYGAVESVGRDGYADILTADAKGMTLLAASGGVIREINKYLRERTVPRSAIPMDIKLAELFHAKYKQMLMERGNRPLLFPTQPFPVPPLKAMEVRSEKPQDPGEVFDVTAHLQPGHLHGKNVCSVGKKTLEQDVFPGQPLQFQFNIPIYYPYFDQWAFRGTYIDKTVGIAAMQYAAVTIPARSPPAMFELEFKSDDITLTTILIDTTHKGRISEDGKWKTLVERINPVPESIIKPFNYISVAVHDPRYLLGAFLRGGREGTVCLKDISLSKKFPFPGVSELAYVEKENNNEEFELIRYWRLNHGNLPFEKDVQHGIYRFGGGSGWRGGYIPYTNLSKFNFLYIKLRNVYPKEACNCFYIELKHEWDQLLTDKIPVHVPADQAWHVVEIPIPPHIRYAFNYLALSDPFADLEIGSLLLTPRAITGIKIEKVDASLKGKRPLECTYRPCPGEPVRNRF